MAIKVGDKQYTGTVNERSGIASKAERLGGLSVAQLKALCQEKVSPQDVDLAARLSSEAHALLNAASIVRGKGNVEPAQEHMLKKGEERARLLSDLYWSVYANHTEQGLTTRLFTWMRDGLSSAESAARNESIKPFR